MLRSAKGSSLAPRPERTTPCSELFSSWRLRYSAEIGLQVSSINEKKPQGYLTRHHVAPVALCVQNLGCLSSPYGVWVFEAGPPPAETEGL